MNDRFMPARRRAPLARDLPAELQVAATNGIILTDSRGRKYIDFVMGWCVGNFGWGRPATTKAIKRFKGPDYVYPGYSYAPWTELARLAYDRRVSSLPCLPIYCSTGRNHSKRACSGPNAFQLAWHMLSFVCVQAA